MPLNNIEVTLLSKKEIEGKSKVLRKIGAGCKKAYWTNYTIAKDFAGVVDAFGYIHYEQIHYSFGVRPVLKLDNIDELIINCPSKFKDGIQIVEYGTYPDLSQRLNIDNPYSFTAKYYNYPIPTVSMIDKSKIFQWYNCPAYIYKNQEIIEMCGCNYPVKPIKFYVDRENSLLISVGILFESPINAEDPEYNCEYNKNFNDTKLYLFLNKQFKNGLLQSYNMSKQKIMHL